MNPEDLALLVRNLPQAESLDLYRLAHAIRALYSEPRRILAVRSRLHVGIVVRFFDDIDGAFRNGRIIALRDRDMTIDEIDRHLRHTHVPYVAIDLNGQNAAEPEIVDPPRQKPEVKRTTRADFSIGEMVTFDDRYQRPVIGKIIRLNQKTATIQADIGEWRVSFGLLRHVVDL
jgi:hypothetical protein